jgi:hypothetical protein
MDGVAKSPAERRAALFTETANRRGMDPVNVEKDFWVTWTLKQLFALPEIGPHLIFKGGTTLSKVYGVIERFSEDIDVSINRDYLGFGGDAEPEKAGGKNKVKERVKQLKQECRRKVHEELAPSLAASISNVLGESGETSWRIIRDKEDPDDQTLLFIYPPGLPPSKTGAPEYVKRFIRIEMGARADSWPASEHVIRSYAAEEFPDLFREPECSINVLEAERTFLEKATLLHSEYYRPADRPTPERHSRHHYDLYRMGIHGLGDRALADPSLMARVVEHKKVFFPRSWAKYDEVLEGGIHLVPADERIDDLRKDYDDMDVMFFGDRPPFEDILKSLATLEEKINRIFRRRDA